MTSEGKTDMPDPNMNPMNLLMPTGFGFVYAGIDYALLKYAGAENALSAAIPLDINAATGGCILVLLAGVVQSLMASKTNWARVHYGVPWPHTFAPEKHKDKLKFDMVQRAHLNFVENYPQYLATAFFALQLAPTLATIFGSFFLLGRVVFALGYYSGDATAKNKGAFGYMLGKFPIDGLCILWLLINLKLIEL